MQTKELIGLYQKDIKEGIRIGKIQIIISFFYSFFLIGIFSVYLPLKATGVGKNHITTIVLSLINYMPFIVIFSMMFLGNSLIQILIAREKTKKTILPLLCLGIKPRTFWLSKLISVFTISFVSAMISIFIIVFIVLFLDYGATVSHVRLIILNIVFIPLFPLFFMGLSGLLYMISLKFWPVSLLFMTIPFFLLPYWNKIILKNIFLVIGLVIIGILLVTLTGYLAGRVSREQLSGVFEQT